ncbi:hypothetical protein EDD21DRAFT_214794 [Dissophora ornata]|nr:hypothetical protein EDD21DRAFT_214794 [Dissophora ornata]
MPSPAPTAHSYLQSLILLQHYQLQQRQLQQQQQEQQHQYPHLPFAHAPADTEHPQQAFTQLGELSEQQLQQQLLFSAPKLKLLQQQQQQHQHQHQQHQSWPSNPSLLSSNSALSATLTSSASRSSSPQFESVSLSPMTTATTATTLTSSSSSSPSSAYYKRRTSATFRSSFSTSPLPSFEPFGFGPDDFLSHRADDDDSDVEYEDNDRTQQQQQQQQQLDGDAHSPSPSLVPETINLRPRKYTQSANNDDKLVRLEQNTSSRGARCNDADDVGDQGRGYSMYIGATVAKLGNLFQSDPACRRGEGDGKESEQHQPHEERREHEDPRERKTVEEEKKVHHQPVQRKQQQLQSEISVIANSSSRVYKKRPGNISDNDCSNNKANAPKQRRRCPMARRLVDDGDTSVDTPKLDLHLDLQSLSALSLSSPQSAVASPIRTIGAAINSSTDETEISTESGMTEGSNTRRSGDGASSVYNR